MTKKVVVFLANGVILLAILYLYQGYPIIINKNQSKVVINLADTGVLNFNPIKNFDFTSGKNKAYLLFSKEDIGELPKGMSRRRLFECKENTILEELQKVFFFNKSNGDMTTCESEILIYNNDKLIFHSAFFFTDSLIGIQNNIVGWAEPVRNDELKKILLKFKAVNMPIIRL